jgi:hypothetical protein
VARRKKDGLTTRKKEGQNWLWTDEGVRHQWRAKGLSVSAYLRTAGLAHHPIQSVLDHAAR